MPFKYSFITSLTFAASDTLGLSPVVFKPVYLKGSGQKRPITDILGLFSFLPKNG